MILQRIKIFPIAHAGFPKGNAFNHTHGSDFKDISIYIISFDTFFIEIHLKIKKKNNDKRAT